MARRSEPAARGCLARRRATAPEEQARRREGGNRGRIGAHPGTARGTPPAEGGGTERGWWRCRRDRCASPRAGGSRALRLGRCYAESGGRSPGFARRRSGDTGGSLEPSGPSLRSEFTSARPAALRRSDPARAGVNKRRVPSLLVPPKSEARGTCDGVGFHDGLAKESRVRVVLAHGLFLPACPVVPSRVFARCTRGPQARR